LFSSSSTTNNSDYISTSATVLSIEEDCIDITPLFHQSSLLVSDGSNLEFQNHDVTLSNLEFSNGDLFQNLTPSEIPLCSHNSTPIIFKMEDDCEDKVKLMPQTSKDMIEMDRLFTTLTQQLSLHMNNLQDQLKANEDRVRQEQFTFQQEMRDEFNELRNYVMSSSSTTTPSVQLPSLPISSSDANVPDTATTPHVCSVPDISTTPSTPTVTGSSFQDMQMKMMLMMTESFNKLSTVLVDTKTSDVKSDWPKFSGDTKKFRSWYLSIMALISIPPWNELYDVVRNDVISTTSNVTLNGKLYAKIVSVLEGQALQDVISRSHLRANGVLLLQELVQTYKPTNVPEVLAAKAGEFWSKLKRSNGESVDSYYNRFRELLDDLDQADDKISTKSAMRHFIFTLGTEFEAIQNNYRIGNLPAEWNTLHWPSLLILCRNYYHSVNPKGILSSDKDSSNDAFTKRMAQQKKVKEWFLNPAKYRREIEQEQLKYADKCIFHLTKSHPTEDCNLKRECDKIVQARKKSGSPQGGQSTNTTGQLRHMTEEVFEDANSAEDLLSVIDDASPGNDTNEDSLYYFARLSNHYLRLVNSSSTSTSSPRHNMKYPVIADSGANYHMFKEKEYFSTILPSTGNVILGDGKTSLTIKGVGTVQCQVGNNILTLHNVRYIPELSESIYSLFQHIQCPGHSLDSSYEGGLYINFPSFNTKAIIGQHDIYLDVQPLSTNVADDSKTYSTSVICRDITEFQQDLQVETDRLDNILQDLRHYYLEVKTKRQLGFDVPAGFRQSSNHQKELVIQTPPRKTKSQLDIPSLSIINDSNTINTENTPRHSNCHSDLEPMSLSQNTASSGPEVIPIIRSVDKVSSSLPKHITMNEDHLRSCVGFRRVESIKKNLKNLYQPTISLDNTPADAILDPGFFASVRKKDRNTTPVARPDRFGDVIHLDIVFGPEISVGNIHYGLLCIDRYSRMSYMYPLQNLTGDIQKQLEYFFSHIGMIPKRIITDFDLKLVGGKTREYLNNLLVHVNAAPSYRQDKNGLAERHWQTMVTMARNWLASAELPQSFWYYAVRRAAEVCNYFPITLEDGSLITPFELVHATKPDLRNLFKPFSLAAVRRERIGNDTLGKFESQSLPMITLGKCPTSNGLLFYNPVNCTFVSSIDYVFQPNTTSGSRFGFKYIPGTFVYRLDETNTIYSPQFPLESNVLVNTHSPPHQGIIVGVPTYVKPDIYAVKFQDGTVAEYSLQSNVLEAVPSSPTPKTSVVLPDWIQVGAPATLFLHTMSKPNHGRLHTNSTGDWVFCKGNKSDLSKGIILPDLSADCYRLLESGQLFKGHTKFSRVYQACQQAHLTDCVLRHISAHGLQSLIPPSSLKHHHSLSSSDKKNMGCSL
jgi:hypothetical protein